jgi:hypothetical protein
VIYGNLGVKINHKSRIPILSNTFKDNPRLFDTLHDIHSGLEEIKSTINNANLQMASPRGAQNGTNKEFILDHRPALVVLNGLVIEAGHKNDYVVIETTNGFKIRFTTPPAATDKIRFLYL